MQRPSAIWKNCYRANELLAASFASPVFTLQPFTIPAGPCAGRPPGCAWRRIICWRARPGFFQLAVPARCRHKLATATRGEALEILRAPGPSTALDRRTLDRPWLRRIYDRLQWTLGVALLNLFPLPRQSGFRKSFAYAGEAVDRGYSVLVFPEGKHTEDGKLCPFRTGVGLLANNLRIPILPMRIDGLFEIKNAKKKYAAPGKIQVHIGKPMQFAPETNPEEIARALQKAVESLTK